MFKFLVRRKKTVGASLTAVVAASIVYIAPHEGLRTKAYLDPVGIPTICYGETLGVDIGDTATVEECKELLQDRALGMLVDMRACTTVELPLKTEAAFLSFTYNLGVGTYCSNMARKRINEGQLEKACIAIKLYNKAGTPLREFAGLTRRRKEESALCLEGLREAGMLQ